MRFRILTKLGIWHLRPTSYLQWFGIGVQAVAITFYKTAFTRLTKGSFDSIPKVRIETSKSRYSIVYTEFLLSFQVFKLDFILTLIELEHDS